MFRYFLAVSVEADGIGIYLDGHVRIEQDSCVNGMLEGKTIIQIIIIPFYFI